MSQTVHFQKIQHQPKSTFSCSLSTKTSTLLTSSFIDSCFPFADLHSLLYSSDSSFISLINNRLDTEDRLWTFRNHLWPHQQVNFKISKLSLFLSKILLQTWATLKEKNTQLIYILFLRAVKYKLKAEGCLTFLLSLLSQPIHASVLQNLWQQFTTLFPCGKPYFKSYHRLVLLLILPTFSPPYILRCLSAENVENVK